MRSYRADSSTTARRCGAAPPGLPRGTARVGAALPRPPAALSAVRPLPLPSAGHAAPSPGPARRYPRGAAHRKSLGGSGARGVTATWRPEAGAPLRCFSAGAWDAAPCPQRPHGSGAGGRRSDGRGRDSAAGGRPPRGGRGGLPQLCRRGSRALAADRPRGQRSPGCGAARRPCRAPEAPHHRCPAAIASAEPFAIINSPR